MDPRIRSGPLDALPEIEIRSWWTFGDSVGRRGYVGKLPLLGTVCRGNRGIIGNNFPILRGGKLCLYGNKSIATLFL